MSLRAEDESPIPEATRRIARSAFPKGTSAMCLADKLGAVYRDEQFAMLFPVRGQPALSPARLALVTVLQFVEGLSDRQAADAVRGRIDWKYALALELTDPGFDHTVLSEFRARLVAGEATLLLLDTLLARSRELGLLKRRGRQRTDSTHVLAAVRVLNRLERVGETLRAALNELATVAPDWLRALAPVAWYERYGARVENYDLPKSDAERHQLAAVIGADGRQLLQAIETADRPELGTLPAVTILRRVWDEQYVETAGQVALRAIEAMPSPATVIASPYDAEARYSSRRGMAWVGYRVQLTETCDPDLPSLIVNVETTPATTPDDTMLAVVHASLAKRDLLPDEHLVDKGYTDSRVLVDSPQRFGVEIVGPVAEDPSWQAHTSAREQHEALRAARERQATPTFRERYAARAGIEATHAQAVRRSGLRNSRYLGLAKTHLQHVATAVAINLVRLGEWWAGHAKAPTRRSHFAALNPAMTVAA
jgi:transposase